jgi:lipoprotein-anchoring transpeptidase ErfK/SrfK
MQQPLIALVFLCLLPFFPFFVHAESPLLTLEKDGEVTAMLSPDIPSVGSLALGDLGTDGVSEILVATGYGTPTEIIALRKDGSHIGSFTPYDAAFSGGASVAICDLDGDGANEIITGAGFSGGPHVRVFTNRGVPTGVQFFAYDEAFRGGVSLLCKDVTGDDIPDIVTVPGPTGGPHLRVFSSVGVLENELMVPNFPSNSGLSIFTLPSSDQTLFVAPASYTDSSSIARVTHTKGSLHVDSTSPAKAQSIPSLSTQDGKTLLEETNIVSTHELRDGSVYRLSAIPTTALSSETSSKYIRVDLSTQTLTAYAYGVPELSFLVSTGVATHPTPLGKTEVLAKLPSHDYSWYYGEGNPANYSLPNVLWNLRFREHYYIHSAYWHNNFGHVMSHGCVNASIPDAEKIYTWAEVGTPVEIVE